MLHFVDDDPDYLGWVTDHPPYRDSEQVLHEAHAAGSGAIVSRSVAFPC
jgi:hypothetical protein